jgi:hypothetical protein
MQVKPESQITHLSMKAAMRIQTTMNLLKMLPMLEEEANLPDQLNTNSSLKTMNPS